MASTPSLRKIPKWISSEHTSYENGGNIFYLKNCIKHDLKSAINTHYVSLSLHQLITTEFSKKATNFEEQSWLQLSSNIWSQAFSKPKSNCKFYENTFVLKMNITLIFITTMFATATSQTPTIRLIHINLPMYLTKLPITGTYLIFHSSQYWTLISESKDPQKAHTKKGILVLFTKLWAIFSTKMLMLALLLFVHMFPGKMNLFKR
jgi:hypothetical protein